MSKVVDAIAPRRFGSNFRLLLATAWTSDLGDGLALAAGPLLVLSQTRDPFLIALATLLQRLPWVVLGLQAGVLADRHDRRRIIVVANLVRAVVLIVLSTMIVTGAVNVAVVLVALTAIGTAEVFVDTTSSTMLPMIVAKDDLGVANSRLIFGRITINRLGGPAIGAFLFAAGMAIPFVVQAVCVVVAARVISSIAVDRPPLNPAPASIRSDILDGVRWVWHHAAIRTLTLTILTINLAFGAMAAILVLYASEQLGLGNVGFGLLASFGAAGGVVTTLTYGWMERHIGVVTIMRGGLLIEAGTHLTLANTTTPAIAFAVFFMLGMHEAAWGTTATTIRQRVVPNEFQGRVSSVYQVGVFASLVLGALIGGIIAKLWGVTGPLWFAFFGTVLILAAIWRQLASIATAE